MSSSDQPQMTTRAFARVLGPFVVIVCGAAAAHTSEMYSLTSDFAANPVWSWGTGPFVLLGGLVIVALHPYWRGLAAATVSTLGWLVVLRGLLMLNFPATFVSLARSVIDQGDLWRALCLIFAAVGGYLTYVGWKPSADRSATPVTAADPALPRAA
jgi:hypothetical protein